MAKILTVFFGAGASFDCSARYRSEQLPQLPLTQNLFQIDHTFDGIHGAKNYLLRKYPGASVIGQLYTNNSASGLESFLREYLDSGDPNKKKVVYQTKFFLREYIGLMSEYIQAELTRSNYASFVASFSKLDFDKILFVTTNYDLLLDYALHDFLRWSFSGWNDYIGATGNGHQGKWFYVKLHGSVNWRNKILRADLKDAMRENQCSTFEELVLHAPQSIIGMPGAFEVMSLVESVFLSRPEMKRDQGLWGSNRYKYDVGNADHMYSPVMVLPQDKKEHICHQTHFDKAKELISNACEFWVIGNSLADTHVRDLIKLLPTDDLKIRIVDPQPIGHWRGKLKEIFPQGNIFFRAAQSHLSNFVQNGMDFVHANERLHALGK